MNNELRSKIFTFGVLLTVIILLIFFTNNNIFLFFKNIISNIFNFFGNILNRFISWTRSIFTNVLLINSVVKENTALEEENRRLISDMTELDNLRKENALLKNALNIKKDNKVGVVLASVVFFGNQSADFIFINKGSRDGIAVGDIAVLSDKIAVGRVVDIFSDSSKILLISSPSSSIGARILNSDTVGIFKGRGALAPEIDLIPRDKDLKIGDVVLTSGFDGLYPQGYVLGKIADFDFSEENIFKKVRVDPIFNIYEVRKLLIISGK